MERRQFIREQISRIEQAAPGKGPNAMMRLLARISGIGIETADTLVHEVLTRNLRDRRAVARYAGLTGAPNQSGGFNRDKGLPSRPREFHPEPLTDPDLTLSHHPARAIDRRLPPSVGRQAPHPAVVGGDIVNAIGHNLAKHLVLEVVHVHALRIALGPVIAAAIAKVANQLLFLRVDRYDRLSSLLRRENFAIDVLELGISIGVMRAFVRLAVGLARKAEPSEQLAHGVRADFVPHLNEGRRQLVEAFRYP